MKKMVEPGTEGAMYVNTYDVMAQFLMNVTCLESRRIDVEVTTGSRVPIGQLLPASPSLSLCVSLFSYHRFS